MRILADSQKSARLDGHVVRPVQHWQLEAREVLNELEDIPKAVY